MNIKRAKEEIKHTVQLYLEKDEDGHYLIPAVRQRPVLLMGAPGIGKTAIMEQIARECGISLVAYTMTHHTRQSALGLPMVTKRVYNGKEYSVTEYTMSEIIASVYERMEATGVREGILFLDEVNCVSETLAPMMLQFLQTKSFGNISLPEGWIIVTAGNPPEYNRSVREFDVVTLDRVKHLRVEADYPVWKEYAREQRIHSSILSYLDHKKENFYRMERTIDGTRFVTARGWEDLSIILYGYERAGIPIDAEMVEAYLQDRSIAVDFANYLELYRKYEEKYQVTDILAGTDIGVSYEQMAEAPFDERISLTSLLLSGLQEHIAGWQEKEHYLEDLFYWLKEWRKRLEKGNGSESRMKALSELEDICSLVENQIIRKRAGKLLSREEEKQKENVLSTLREYRVRLSEKESENELFPMVQKWFEEEVTAREAQIVQIQTELEHAFGFMERAFGEGSEMIYFVTELESDHRCLSFIRDHGSDAFYRHSNRLFVDEKREELLKRMDFYLQEN